MTELPVVVPATEMSNENLGKHFNVRHVGAQYPFLPKELTDLTSPGLLGALRAYHRRLHQTQDQNHTHPDL
jgi:hypothetical protein